MLYSVKECLQFYNVSRTTFFRRVRELKQAGKFKKESPGYFYTESEAQKLGDLLGFNLPTKTKPKKKK